jgi:hypothetical protein
MTDLRGRGPNIVSGVPGAKPACEIAVRKS